MIVRHIKDFNFFIFLSQGYPEVCVHLIQFSVTASSPFTTLNILIQKYDLALLENSLSSKNNYVHHMEIWTNVFPKELSESYRKASFYWVGD